MQGFYIYREGHGVFWHISICFGGYASFIYDQVKDGLLAVVVFWDM